MQVSQPLPRPVESAARPSGDCASPALFVVLLLWMLALAVARVFAAYSLSVNPTESSNRAALGYGVAEVILLGLPLLPLALRWRQPVFGAIFQTWALAAGLAALLLPVQLTNATAAQAQAVLHILLALAFAGLVWVLGRRREREDAAGGDADAQAGVQGFSPGAMLALALLVAAVDAMPWLAWGALGSPLDTLLQLLAALALGLAAALVFEYFLFRPLFRHMSSPLAAFLLGGLAAGGALAVIASATGFGFGAMQALLMLVLPALGWALAGLRLLARGRAAWLPGALLAGLAAAAPMALIDADELALVITASPGEILGWAFRAAGASLLIGWGSGLLLLVLVAVRRRPAQEQAALTSPRRSPLGALLAVTALAAWLIAGWVYFSSGQPGFYGEGMFVILKDQADVSSAASMTDYNARREYVYQTLVNQANESQGGIRQALDRLNIAYQPYYLVNAIQVPASPFLRLWLESRPEVERILDNPLMRPLAEPPPISQGGEPEPTGPEWNLTMIGADRVWNDLGITGEGILVGQSDSGAQGDHPELAPTYRGRGGDDDYNWLDPWNNSTSPTDIGGHGTHTLGSILGQHTGVAPGAQWIACVNLARNLGNPGYYLDCMQFMLAPFPQGGDPLADGDPALGAHVLNNSWGCPDVEGCDAQAFLPAVRALRAAGVFVVVSAGNDGPGCGSLNTPPAIYQDVFVVGAVNRAGNLASFSSIGPVTADGSGRVKPDIVAPGVSVLSSFPGSTYASNSGTSMAGPHVVGVVALMWSANPALIGDIERTGQILEQTAQPFTQTLPACPGAGETPSTAVGYGIVDAYAAVQQAMQK